MKSCHGEETPPFAKPLWGMLNLCAENDHCCFREKHQFDSFVRELPFPFPRHEPPELSKLVFPHRCCFSFRKISVQINREKLSLPFPRIIFELNRENFGELPGNYVCLWLLLPTLVAKGLGKVGMKCSHHGKMLHHMADLECRKWEFKRWGLIRKVPAPTTIKSARPPPNPKRSPPP